RDRIGRFALTEQRDDRAENFDVALGEEILRAQGAHGLGQRAGGEHHRAEHGLLGLGVVRRQVTAGLAGHSRGGAHAARTILRSPPNSAATSLMPPIRDPIRSSRCLSTCSGGRFVVISVGNSSLCRWLISRNTTPSTHSDFFATP